MKKLLSIIASLAIAAVATAQEPPPPTPTIAGIGAALVQYLMQHGDVGTGYGTELRGKAADRGVTINYNLETPQGIRFGSFESRLALGYTVTYSEPVSRQHLVLSMPVYHYVVPASVAGVLNTPKDTLDRGPVPSRTLSSLWPNLGSWKIQPAIGLRPEDIYDMQFHWKRVFIGVQFQAKFN